MRIVDRMVLEYVWPALALAALIEAASWPLGPALAMFDGALAAAIGSSIAFRVLVRRGELGALQQAGVSPRRSIASAVLAAGLLAAGSAAAACALGHPAARTQYARYVLMALQLPLMTSLALPVAARPARRDPWAFAALLLLGFVVLNVTVRVIGSIQGWAPGLETGFADIVLAGADVVLYRQVTRPRSRP